MCWGRTSYRPGALAGRAHLDAHVGVVSVCPCPQVFASSLGPQEVAQELGAVLEVVAAHAPLPGLPALQARRVVAGAALHAPGAAGPRQSVGEGGRGHRVQEGRLLETWAGEQNKGYVNPRTQLGSRPATCEVLFKMGFSNSLWVCALIPQVAGQGNRCKH